MRASGLVSQTFRRQLSRRGFIRTTGATAGCLVLGCSNARIRHQPESSAKEPQAGGLSPAALPKGSAPAPLILPHFPDRLHAYIWRNWPLVPLGRIAAVAGATPAEIAHLAGTMGLSRPPRIVREQERRSHITIIKRNWHLLPYEQLLELLDWTPEQLAYTLREDDFLFIKLGSLKPRCEPLNGYVPMDLCEKVLNCRDLLERWLPSMRGRVGGLER